VNKRIWRCLFADLAAGTLELKTRKTLPRNTAGDALVLATDVLAGTGGLAFDRMTWRMPDGSKTTYTGRLAAALRYAGADALVLSGKRKNPGVLVLAAWAGHVDDIADIVRSGGAFHEGLALRSALRDRYLTDDTVIAIAEDGGVIETGGRCIADAAVSEALREKGFCAIVAVGTGALEVADPQALIEGYMQYYREGGTPAVLAVLREACLGKEAE
jgi:hypothetical protein